MFWIGLLIGIAIGLITAFIYQISFHCSSAIEEMEDRLQDDEEPYPFEPTKLDTPRGI